MSDTTIIIIVAIVIALHFIVGFGWVILKMTKRK